MIPTVEEAALRGRINKLETLNAELLAAYEGYIKMLEIELSHLSGLAYVHGYRCDEALVKRGEEARAAIAKAKGGA